MAYHLICVHPFGKYKKGQCIKDPFEVGLLMDDRDHHFVRVAVPDPAPVAEPTVESVFSAEPAPSESTKRSTRPSS